MKKRARKRAPAGHTAQNARDQSSTGKMDWVRCPPNMSIWCPEKAGEYKLNFLIYEVGDNHPDRIEKDVLWYKLPVSVHRNVGVEEASIVCPGTFGKSCPICERRNVLRKDWDENEKECKELNAQKWVLYNIIDPENKGKLAIFAFSRRKFAEVLEKELLAPGKEEDQLFYDVTEDGRTVTVRFANATFGKHKYLQAERIDFSPRKTADEDAVLDRTVCLEECLVLLEYKEIKRLFEGDQGTDSPTDDGANQFVDESGGVPFEAEGEDPFADPEGDTTQEGEPIPPPDNSDPAVNEDAAKTSKSARAVRGKKKTATSPKADTDNTSAASKEDDLFD